MKKWFASIGRDGTKMAWLIIIIILLATITGLWLLPLAATKWSVLLKFKDNVYSLIEKLYMTIVLPVVNEIRKAMEKKYGLNADPIPPEPPKEG